jgi:hypothetical protein
MKRSKLGLKRACLGLPRRWTLDYEVFVYFVIMKKSVVQSNPGLYSPLRLNFLFRQYPSCKSNPASPSTLPQPLFTRFTQTSPIDPLGIQI